MSKEMLQQALVQVQAYQQQLQVVSSQKDALNLQLIEHGKALDELSKPSKEDVYRIMGPVLIKEKRDKAKKELESKKEMIMLRLKTLEKSEKTLNEKLEGLKKQLTAGE